MLKHHNKYKISLQQTNLIDLLEQTRLFKESKQSLNNINLYLEKSNQSLLLAIEAYNQPNVNYREEGFCLLFINAWEVLLKAKLLQDKNTRQTTSNNKEPLSLNKLLNIVFDHQDHLIRKNIETLQELKDAMLGLFIDSKQHLNRRDWVKAFQTGVNNYKTSISQWFPDHSQSKALSFEQLTLKKPKRQLKKLKASKQDKSLIAHWKLQFNSIQHLDATASGRSPLANKHQQGKALLSKVCHYKLSDIVKHSNQRLKNLIGEKINELDVLAFCHVKESYRENRQKVILLESEK